VKFIKQVLPTAPLILVVFFILRHSLSAEGCYGLIEFFYSIFLYVLLFITTILAFALVFRKGQKPPIITYSIIALALSILFAGKMWGEKLKGNALLYAVGENNRSSMSSASLLFRNNGTFVFTLGHVDFSCFYSGRYQKINDTIILDSEPVNKSGAVLTSRYYLKGEIIAPISDTTTDKTKYVVFKIQAK
jgi:hypothetical protein